MKSSSGFGTFTLEVQKEKLVDAPGFDKHQWPDMGNPTWASTVRDYWQTSPH